MHNGNKEINIIFANNNKSVHVAKYNQNNIYWGRIIKILFDWQMGNVDEEIFCGKNKKLIEISKEKNLSHNYVTIKMKFDTTSITTKT